MRRVPDSNYPVRDLFGKGKHGFGPGDKTNGTIATIPGAAFMNAVQEEIANAIEGMGVALDPENNAQLLDVLKKRIVPLLGSIADLRAFSGGDKVKIVHVAGYHADSPGLGGGTFVADFDKTRSDDGGTVIVSADGTHWLRHAVEITPYDFGAKKDEDAAEALRKIAALNQPVLINEDISTSYIDNIKFYGSGVVYANIDGLEVVFKCAAVPQFIPKTLIAYDDGSKELSSVLYIGSGAGENAKQTESMITAIGGNAMQRSGGGDASSIRVTAVGAHALRSADDAYAVTAVGDSALEHASDLNRFTAIGSNAAQFAGCMAPQDNKHDFFLGSDQYGLEAANSSFAATVGTAEMPKNLPVTANDAANGVAIGRNALLHAVKTQDDTAIGYNALAHGWATKNNVAVGESAMRNGVSVIGNVCIGSKAGRSMQTAYQNVAVGFEAMQANVHSRNNTAVGWQAAYSLSGNSSDPEAANAKARQNTAIGAGAMKNAASGINQTAIGNNALMNAIGTQSVAVGVESASKLTSASNCTFVGYSAGNNNPGGTQNSELINSTAIGFEAPLSGNNQIQLGNSATTVYVYGSVQSRSDARDKIDIKDTDLGLDFLKLLRPVDYRFDYRDSYIHTDYDGNIISSKKDGSRAGTRYHHGLIAQEVAAVLEQHNIDFGGYQDHSISGGGDVKSIGYQEFISIIIKAIQELDKKIEGMSESD